MSIVDYDHFSITGQVKRKRKLWIILNEDYDSRLIGYGAPPPAVTRTGNHQPARGTIYTRGSFFGGGGIANKRSKFNESALIDVESDTKMYLE